MWPTGEAQQIDARVIGDRMHAAKKNRHDQEGHRDNGCCARQIQRERHWQVVALAEPVGMCVYAHCCRCGERRGAGENAAAGGAGRRPGRSHWISLCHTHTKKQGHHTVNNRVVD